MAYANRSGKCTRLPERVTRVGNSDVVPAGSGGDGTCCGSDSR
jgi:hypothetical protein